MSVLGKKEITIKILRCQTVTLAPVFSELNEGVLAKGLKVKTISNVNFGNLGTYSIHLPPPILFTL